MPKRAKGYQNEEQSPKRHKAKNPNKISDASSSTSSSSSKTALVGVTCRGNADQTSSDCTAMSVTQVFDKVKSSIIRNESIDVIKSQIEKSLFAKRLIETKDNQGHNLLHISTQFEHLTAMQYFVVECCIDVNSIANGEDSTALHIALYSQKKNQTFIEIIRFLLENGANLYSFDDKANTFVHLLPYYLLPDLYHDTVKLLISLGHENIFHWKNSQEQTPLHLAVEELKLSKETLQLISTACHFNFNTRHTDGNTLLHYAARWGGKRQTMENIVDLGGDWRMTNDRNETVLHLAVEGNNFDAIHYFISLGADINARDCLGRTPLHHIESHETESKKHYIKLTTLLLDHGADIYATDNYGETVANDLFTEASREDFTTWARFVISKGHGQLFQVAANEKNLKPLN